MSGVYKIRSPEQKRRLRQLVEAGATYREIARAFGCCPDVARDTAIRLGYAERHQKVRFTADDIALLKREWAAYTPARQIAAMLNRDTGTVRQKVSQLGLRRSFAVSNRLRFAPAAVKAVLADSGPQAFIAAHSAWQAQKKAEERASREEEAEAFRRHVAEMRERHAVGSMPRNEAIFFLRRLGVTLEAIGQEFGITRERVRQLCDRARAWPAARERYGEFARTG